jgi:hypothetical protein
MTCYVVLWIPTIHHRLPCALSHSCRDDISDLNKEPFNVSIDLDQENGNILISTGTNKVKKDKDTYELFISLKQEEVSHNGMILYSYESKYYGDNQEDGFRFTEDHFPQAIYHIIKSFYHHHDFHDKKADALLKPYISKDYISINTDNNDAILYYLNMYEAFLDGIINNIRTVKDNLRGKSYEAITILYTKAKGFHVYLNALYHSPYNTKCRLDNNSFDESDQAWRRCAFNIENTINYLDIVEREYGVYHQFDITKQARRWAKRGFYIGLAGALIGLVALLYTGFYRDIITFLGELFCKSI